MRAGQRRAHRSSGGLRSQPLRARRHQHKRYRSGRERQREGRRSEQIRAAIADVTRAYRSVATWQRSARQRKRERCAPGPAKRRQGRRASGRCSACRRYTKAGGDSAIPTGQTIRTVSPASITDWPGPPAPRRRERPAQRPARPAARQRERPAPRQRRPEQPRWARPRSAWQSVRPPACLPSR